jgi:hypothetical protein
MSRLPSSALEGARVCIHPDHSGLSTPDLEWMIASSLAAMPEDTAEDFLGSLASFGKSVAPLLARAAPDVAKGAATGSTFGPWGAVIGAGAGLASSLLKSQAKPTPSSPAAPSGSVATAPQAKPSPLPTGQAASATLLGLFQDPTVQQALISQVLGGAGNQQVKTPSGATVPNGAINTLLTQLLSHASEALPESQTDSESYLKDPAGEYLIDPASSDQHAALVLSYLQRPRRTDPSQSPTEWEEFLPLAQSSEEWPEFEESFAAEFY